MKRLAFVFAIAAAGCTSGEGPSRGDAGTQSVDAAVADGGANDAGSIMSAGCTTGNGLAEGEHSFAHEGQDRRFIVRLPTGYSRDTSWPLLFALHPNGGAIDYWDGQGGDRDIRAEVSDQAILIVTEAIGGNWRDYDEPSDTWAARLEVELGYFDEIFAQATRELCVDQTSVFSMGFSGGGSFSGVLGCRRSYIRAFAGGGAVEYFDRSDCVQSSPAWITIGTEELNPGREAFRDFFRESAGCEATSSAAEPSPCVAYDSCDPGSPVQYCQHPGDHIWPAFGTAAAWGFLRQFTN